MVTHKIFQHGIFQIPVTTGTVFFLLLASGSNQQEKNWNGEKSCCGRKFAGLGERRNQLAGFKSAEFRQDLWITTEVKQ
jgi:hypothetical protein